MDYLGIGLSFVVSVGLLFFLWEYHYRFIHYLADRGYIRCHEDSCEETATHQTESGYWCLSHWPSHRRTNVKNGGWVWSNELYHSRKKSNTR